MECWLAGTIDEVIEAASRKWTKTLVTNPTVMAGWCEESGLSLEDVSLKVVGATGLSLYVQLRGPSVEKFVAQSNALRHISPLILPKLPCTIAALEACRILRDSGCPVLITTVCSINQAWLCAEAGATSICPYFARLDESGGSAQQLIADVAELYKRHSVKTAIMPASVRDETQVTNCLKAGADGVILFVPLYRKLFAHSVSDDSLLKFEQDWQRIPSSFS
jgi:transaldolase